MSSSNDVRQIRASVDGDEITAAISGHSSQPQHNSKDVLEFKAISMMSTGSSGLVAIHLTADPVGKWFLADVVAGAAPTGYLFDAVGDDTLGTTITLDEKFRIHPSRYVATPDQYI